MVERRDVLNRLVLGGTLTALVSGAPAVAAAAEAAPQDSRDEREVAQAIQAVRSEIARQAIFWEINAVRDQLRAFLRTNGKFPDYIEVGVDPWQRVYDWHVRYGQPLKVSRTADARYAIQLMETTVIMRTDQAPDYIGLPFDNR